jgi:hypothetical protein
MAKGKAWPTKLLPAIRVLILTTRVGEKERPNVSCQCRAGRDEHIGRETPATHWSVRLIETTPSHFLAPTQKLGIIMHPIFHDAKV